MVMSSKLLAPDLRVLGLMNDRRGDGQSPSQLHPNAHKQVAVSIVDLCFDLSRIGKSLGERLLVYSFRQPEDQVYISLYILTDRKIYFVFPCSLGRYFCPTEIKPADTYVNRLMIVDKLICFVTRLPKSCMATPFEAFVKTLINCSIFALWYLGTNGILKRSSRSKKVFNHWYAT